MSDFRPNYLITHDYGAAPKNQDGVFNPYHALVFPDGSKRYRNPGNPYGAPAPHAYKLNPQSIGLSYAGQVGSQPTPAAMATLKAEYDAINKQFPGIKQMGHGEAFAREKFGLPRASKNGRDMIEASWRSQLGGPSQPGMGAPTNIDAGLPKNPSFMQYRGANSGSIQAPSLSMPTAPPSFDETPQASNPNAAANQPRDQRGMGGETRIFGGGPGPMPQSPAGGARAASELQDGTSGTDPAKFPGPQWSQEAGRDKITWGDGSSNALGPGGGGNQAADANKPPKFGGPAAMPLTPGPTSAQPNQVAFNPFKSLFGG